jgi:hypothetical protein
MKIIQNTLMIVNMIADRNMMYISIFVNIISHHSGVALLPLAISGEPFTLIKKALFHGRLRVFGQ